MLGHAHDLCAKGPSSVSVRGLPPEYGAYVGEVIRRSEPKVYWTRQPSRGSELLPSSLERWRIQPVRWCAERIPNGDDDSVWFKYSVPKDSGWNQMRIRRSRSIEIENALNVLGPRSLLIPWDPVVPHYIGLHWYLYPNHKRDQLQ